MDGRRWFLPLVVLLSWFLLHPLGISTTRAESATGGKPTGSAVGKPAKQKRASGKKAQARKTTPGSRRTVEVSGSSMPPSPGTKSPALRRLAAQNLLLRRLAAAGLLSRPGPHEAVLLEAWKIRTVDGDTFWYGTERVRVRGYDAPELSQPGGFDATHRLDALLHDGEVRMYTHGLDVYGRTLADVYVDQRSVAEVMIEEGYTKKR